MYISRLRITNPQGSSSRKSYRANSYIRRLPGRERLALWKICSWKDLNHSSEVPKHRLSAAWYQHLHNQIVGLTNPDMSITLHDVTIRWMLGTEQLGPGVRGCSTCRSIIIAPARAGSTPSSTVVINATEALITQGSVGNSVDESGDKGKERNNATTHALGTAHLKLKTIIAASLQMNTLLPYLRLSGK